MYYTDFAILVPLLCAHSLCLYVQYFRGNRDRNTVVMHILRPKIEARVVRVHPVRWVNHISMRVEFYGRAAGRFTKLLLALLRLYRVCVVNVVVCCCCCLLLLLLFVVVVVVVVVTLLFTLDTYAQLWRN